MLGPDGEAILRETERMVMLNVIDNQWKDHLLSMDHLKEGIGLRGYGQKDPLVEYKKESFTDVPGHDGPHRRRDRPVPVLHAALRGASARPELPYPEIEEWDEEESAQPRTATARPMEQATTTPRRLRSRISRGTFSGRRKRSWPTCSSSVVTGASTEKQPVVKGPKVGRNDPCPCGSGKKYKKCHGVSA